MNSFEIIGFTKDYRTNTTVLYAQIKIEEYLSLVGKDFDRFEIQRKREKHKGYNRLKRDIENGALIPTITLAVEPSVVKNFSEALEQKNKEKLVEGLLILTSWWDSHTLGRYCICSLGFSTASVCNWEQSYDEDHLVRK